MPLSYDERPYFSLISETASFASAIFPSFALLLAEERKESSFSSLSRGKKEESNSMQSGAWKVFELSIGISPFGGSVFGGGANKQQPYGWGRCRVAWQVRKARLN